MKKRFMLDTSVLLSDSNSLFNFENNNVYIPYIVCEEINNLKSESSERGFMAREMQRILFELSKVNPLSEGVRLGDVPKSSYLSCKITDKNKNTIITRVSHLPQDIRGNEILSNFKFDENDYRIIVSAKLNNAILISKDRGLLDFASDFVEAQEYVADTITQREIFKGYKEVYGSEVDMKKLKDGELQNIYGLYPNEFLIMKNENNPNTMLLGILKVINGKESIKYCDLSDISLKRGVMKPEGLEQKMLKILLLDETIKCVTVTGVSGKGKTLISTDFALEMVDSNNYDSFLYTKSTISTDKNEELGYYKGDMNGKLKPHIQPLINSLEFINSRAKKPRFKGIRGDELLDKYEELGIITPYPLANIRGVSLNKKVVMLDEAQNITRKMMKTLVTRISDSSKLIIGGDFEQIDDPFLNKYNNGLSHLIEKGKMSDCIAHIHLDLSSKTKRGSLSEFGVKYL